MNRRQQAETLISQCEGRKTSPYQDSRGVWTIGCGATRDPHDNPVTQHTPPVIAEQIDQMLERDLAWAGLVVDKHVDEPLTDNQWAALTSFVFNEGTGKAGVKDGFVVLQDGQQSTLLKLLNLGRMIEAAEQFSLWNKCAGRVVGGLIARRKLERGVFLGLVRLDSKAEVKSQNLPSSTAEPIDLPSPTAGQWA